MTPAPVASADGRRASVSAAEVSALRGLARLYGLQTRYRDTRGRLPHASADVLVAVLRALGAPLESASDAPAAMAARRTELEGRLVDPVLVAWDGCLPGVELGAATSVGATAATLTAEGGGERCVATRRSPGGRAMLWHEERLPPGYHTLDVECGSDRGAATVIAAPRRAWQPAPERVPMRGVFAPVYALRSERSLGAGNVGDLEELANWASALGMTVAGTLPLLATFLELPDEVSPYMPVSRRMWNELFVDLDRVPELAASGEARSRLEQAGAIVHRLRAAELVDYGAQATVQRAVLEPLARWLAELDPARHAAMDEFLRDRPDVVDYARFRAAGERYGIDWHRWPEPARAGELGTGDVDPSVVEYHAYVQWLIHEQLRALGAGLDESGGALYLDLPLGVHPLGWDAWRCRDQLVDGLSVGAPPDPMAAGGQNWGFAPLHPTRSREAGHSYFRSCIARHASVAGVLRLDHVMGLHRVFCIPHGYAEGVYVRQPADELWAIVCLESHRHRCVMVGENLGMVPAEVNRALRRHHVRGMWVAQFDPLDEPDEGWLACLDTHDTPTFAGWWASCDSQTRQRIRMRLPHDGPEGADEQNGENGENDEADARSALAAMLRMLGESDAGIDVVMLEDLWLETERQNVPGTTTEHPNWRRRMRYDLETIRTDPEIAGLLRQLMEGSDDA